MQYYSAYAMVLYSLGIRAAFYTVLIRFSSTREKWYPDKMVGACSCPSSAQPAQAAATQVHCCCTQARNALGVMSLLCEALDAGLALVCGSDLYLARRALGDCITLGRSHPSARPSAQV